MPRRREVQGGGVGTLADSWRPFRRWGVIAPATVDTLPARARRSALGSHPALARPSTSFLLRLLPPSGFADIRARLSPSEADKFDRSVGLKLAQLRAELDLLDHAHD